MAITALFAALLVPLYLTLTLRVIGLRRAKKVSIGDGGDKLLQRTMRVQANFAENVPYALILMGLAENLRASSSLLYGIGAGLVFGRLLHAFGVSQSKEVFAFRVIGMLLTLAAIGVAGVTCIVLALGR